MKQESGYSGASFARVMALILAMMVLLPLAQELKAGNDEATLRKRAERIHASAITIDSHNDTPLRMMQEGFNMAVRHDARKEYSKVDFIRMKEGGLDGAFFALFISQGPRNAEANEKVKHRMLRLFDTLDAVVQRNGEIAVTVTRAGQVNKVEKMAKRAVFLGIENGYAIGNDLSLLSTYYLRGARYVTLCHTKNNDICDSSTDTVEHNGLSPFGYEVVREMNQLGIMVDVSHISDKAVMDVLSVSRAPIIASHSCAMALCNNPRNLTDELIRSIAAKGGVIQMCILSDYVKTPEPNSERDSARAAVRKQFRNFDDLTDAEMKVARAAWTEVNKRFPAKLATVADVVNHIDHMVKVAGIDHVGIGTDFDGGGGVEGCFDVSEMGNITLELVKRGYSAGEIKKIWGGNLLRVMKKNERIADAYRRDCHCN